MRRLRLCRAALLVVMAVMLGACSDDDECVPSYITDMLVATTNGDALVSEVRIDDGTVYAFACPTIKADVADTTYRCLATFAKSDEGLTFYSMKNVYSQHPKAAEEFSKEGDKLQRHPVKLLSVWPGGGYINMCVGVMTNGAGSHTFGFCIDSIVGATEYVSLLHRSKDDTEAYTSQVYMSMPMCTSSTGISEYVFRVNTYEGMYEERFEVE